MKTYELTQEQIDKLAEKTHAKELLKEFVPEAFETKLEVGKWYIHKEHKELINIAEINKKDEIKFYGFYYDKSKNTSIFVDERNSPSFYGDGKNFSNWRLATEEEVREALINEAKKRGYKIGVKVKSELDLEISEITDDNFEYIPEGNALRVKVSSIFYNKRNLFNNGKWMEIIKEAKETEPTKEEINRVLNYLLKNGEKLL